MIAVVDDDGLIRAFLSDALVEQGFQVEAFPDALAALERLGAVAPQLVISDIVMPGLDGLAFRRAYAARFPARRTPFLFLSSLGSDADQVAGLDAGADDYLVKPVSPALLLARVRACLRRAEGTARAEACFQGELERCPFARLVEFCEAQGFTGQVEVVSDEITAAVPFRGGEIDDGSPEQTALLDRLFELRSGFFLLRPSLPDFAPLHGEARPLAATARPGTPPAQPVGRLSALSVGRRRLQLQTEFVTTPQPAVVSVAVLEGRTVLKRTSAADAAERAGRQRQVDAQHDAVEAEIRERLTSLAARKSEPAASESNPTMQRDELIERGLAAFLAGDHQAALASWEAAAVLDPHHRSLQVNLGVVRRKLAAS